MKRFALATLLLFTSVVAMPATASAQQPAKPSALNIPVTGTAPGGTFVGTFQLQKFATDQGQLVASGVLTGVATNTATGVTTSVMRTVALPAAVTDATCAILHLDLGPLNLDILGLQVDLSRIVLDITAQSGAGNLLGNLLCGVANLLNDPTGLSGLLNRILDILR